jgi:hypothetical protein
VIGADMSPFSNRILALFWSSGVLTCSLSGILGLFLQGLRPSRKCGRSL